MAHVDHKMAHFNDGDDDASCSTKLAKIDAENSHTKDTNSHSLVEEEEIFDLERLELGDDDESWLLAAPGVDRKTDRDKSNILKWLRKDYDRLDLRTRKALITRLEDVVKRRDEDLVTSRIEKSNSTTETPKMVSKTPESLNKTYKIDKIVPIKRPCSPNNDDLSRKLSFEEKDDQNHDDQQKIDNHDSKRKKSIDNSPDMNQIRLLASRQEQDLRNCMQQTQLSHQKRKISSCSSSNAEAKNQSNVAPGGLAPPKNCANYTTTLKNRQNGTPKQRLNGFSAQKDLAFQKSLPNLLDENFGQSPAEAVDPLAASCHVHDAAPIRNSARNADSSSASDKGSYGNLNGVQATTRPFPIANSASSHTVSANVGRATAPEFKRPLSSRLPTPRSRLPMPGSALKPATKFQRVSHHHGWLSQLCTGNADDMIR